MEKAEKIHELKVEAKIKVLDAVITHYEQAARNNDSEMVSALAESLKAVLNP
ncbi:hypothetical protein IGI39_004037 [Enterococcus sp. AZ135]|uniref:hypothetical protein n=1 Tax=unclassified Enterococcus TaxID=2608891 RepID=UPI003F25132E